MNTGVHVPLQISDLVSLDMYSRVELLDHMVLVSVFCETSILFSTVATPVYISTNSA